MSHIKDDVERIHIKIHQSHVRKNIEPENVLCKKAKTNLRVILIQTRSFTICNNAKCEYFILEWTT